MNTLVHCWFWPDHVISKGESRLLREEHNAAVNSHETLLAACENAQRYIGLIEQNPNRVADIEWTPIYTQLRQAIAQAEGNKL